MEVVYRAIDGKEFDNEADCCYHEHVLKEGIIMMRRDGKITNQTDEGFLVWLRDESANLVFHSMAEEQGDKQVTSIVKGEDYGLFLWDDCVESYRWIDAEELERLVEMSQLIKARKEESNV